MGDFLQNTGVFAIFGSLADSGMPQLLLRFYYVLNIAGNNSVKPFRNYMKQEDLAPRARFELATLRLTAGAAKL
jgi:hypothetical protein